MISVSNKDFIGEPLDAALDRRLSGTLAVAALTAAWGAGVFRVHNVQETRDVIDMVAMVLGHAQPRRVARGLA